ncbi:MAG: hypothetical protein OXC31_02885, partial [Spirochaetaceae bacterium]|nr:hypothetical protein [Spirochaetaceae bacterium]
RGPAEAPAAGGRQRAGLDRRRAVADGGLPAWLGNRPRLQADQAARRHAAGALSDTELADAALPLQEAEDAAHAAVYVLGGAYLALAIDLSVDLQEALAAVTG